MILNKIKITVAAGSSILLTGCYFADDFFLEQELPPPPSLQDRSQSAVENYIRKGITTETYRPYGFSEVVIHVPQELKELEQMEAEHEKGLISGATSDSAIASKRNYIEANHIQRTAYIEHFFTLKTTTGNLQVLEARYVLDDTLGVKEVTPITILEIPDSYEQALNYFFHNYTVFLSPDISEARALSNKFYTFFKNELDRKTDIQSRSDFYFNCLKITEMIRVSGVFDPNLVAQTLVRDEQLQSVPADRNQKDLAFSPLYEKSTENNVKGYYIFYKFSQTIDGTTDTSVLRFDFSAYYEIESKTWINPPFDSYF